MSQFSQEKWLAILDAIEWFQAFCRDNDPAQIRALRDYATLAARVEELEANNYHDAYRGARDDLMDWKRRALEAEALLSAERGTSANLADALAKEVNGPTFMGEPALRAARETLPELPGKGE